MFKLSFNAPIVQTGNVPSYDGCVPVPKDDKPPSLMELMPGLFDDNEFEIHSQDPGTPGRMYAKAAIK